jgi:uncharacterized protein YuzE
MKLHFSYDKHADVLYAFKDVPKEAWCEEVSDGILIRRDIDTDEIIGFTIVNFKRQRAGGFLKTIPHFGKVSFPREIVKSI